MSVIDALQVQHLFWLGIPSLPISLVPRWMLQKAEGACHQTGEPRVAPYASWSLTFQPRTLRVAMRFVKITRSPPWEREPRCPARTAVVAQAKGFDNEQGECFCSRHTQVLWVWGQKCEVADCQLADSQSQSLSTLWSSFAFSASAFSVFIAWLPLAYAAGKSLAMCTSNSPHPWVHSWYALSIHFPDSWGLRSWVSTPVFSLKMSHVHLLDTGQRGIKNSLKTSIWPHVIEQRLFISWRRTSAESSGW